MWIYYFDKQACVVILVTKFAPFLIVNLSMEIQSRKQPTVLFVIWK